MTGQAMTLTANHDRMHVLFIAPQPFYEDRGTPIAVYEVLEAMCELGFKVDVATYPVGIETGIPGIRLFRTANPLRYRSVPIGLSMRKVVLDICLLTTVLRLVKQNHYDCVHGVEEGAAMALVCKTLFGIPVIYDMQSSLPEQLRKERWFKAGPGRWLSLLFERWLIRSADCIVASRGLAPHVCSIDPQQAVFDCFFSGQSPRPRNEQLAKDLGVFDRPAVLYTGNFTPYQGLEILMEVAANVREEIPEVLFLLIGGTEVEISHLSRLIEQQRLVDTVHVHPRRPRKEIPDFLALAHALVLPRSSGENVPLKIYDYLKSGKPVVATDIPAHSAVLSEETAILVEPTAEALSKGILLALKDTELSKKIATAAKTLAVIKDIKPLRETIAEAYRHIKDVGTKRN
jgi:glycosyltransferase involved in cell wall biosynthesis